MTPSTILREHLEKHGLLEWFDHWSFSDEVGVYKPDRRIFDHALAGLGGVDPAEAAHIGDLRRTDIAGAKALGITAVRYTGVFDDPPAEGLPEADLVVADHADLATALLSADPSRSPATRREGALGWTSRMARSSASMPSAFST